MELQVDKELLKEIKLKMARDPLMQEVITKLRNGEWKDSRIALGLCQEEEGLLTYEGLLWIPDDNQLRLRLLYDHHNALVAGHPGRAKTLELISRNYYWPYQRQYVSRYIDHCDTCKRIKPVKHATFGLLKPLHIPDRPWDMISMDSVTGLPPVDGCNALWVIVDRLTMMAHFVPCSDTMKPRQLADSFILHIVRTHGLPNGIVSDQRSLFTSKFWIHIMGALGTTRNLSTAFHPETDGQTERVNAIMEQYLRGYCNYQQDNWKQLLPIAEFYYNNTQPETTRVTPFYANYGYHPRFEPDLGSVSTEALEVSEYVTALNNLHTELRAEIAYAQAAHAEQANKTRYPDPVLELGDRVWLRWKHVKTTRPSGKLDYKLIGPYTILERVGSRAYTLDLPPSIQLHPVFHISLLEPAEPDSEPIPGHIQPPPPPVIIDNEKEWELEEIVDSRQYRNQLQYRVKWTGFHDQDKAWYPAMNFENSQDAVQQFHTRYPQKPAPRN
jgi:hypothetical protein